MSPLLLPLELLWHAGGYGSRTTAALSNGMMARLPARADLQSVR